jgi:4-amino-4-deoxy-L-arabinose transferase-like glycosyltransferase
MIAYFIHLTNYISESEWGVRLVNVFSLSVSSIYIYKLASIIFDKNIALKAIIIFSSIILVHAGFIITTPDSPLILFWTLSLYYAYKAIFLNSRIDYILAGIVLGMMMLSKYTSILFIVSLILFLAIKRRDVFKNINFYISAFISIIIVSPMLLWNYQHDWISFNFQLNHASGNDNVIKLDLLLSFIAGQFAIFSPIFAAVLFYYLFKEKLFFKNTKLFFISIMTAITLIFFMYKGLYANMELNWVAPAYISGSIVTAYVFQTNKLNKLFKIAVIVALIFTILGRVLFLTNLEIVQDRMYGNKEAVKLLQTFIKDGDSVYGDHLTIAAYLTYYLKNHPDSDVITKSRYSQYDMWRKNDYIKNGLVLSQNPIDKFLSTLYSDVKLLKTLTVKKGIDRKKTFYIYRVKNPLK